MRIIVTRILVTAIHTSRDGHRSPRRCRSWEFGDGGSIPGGGKLLTLKRQTEGTCRRRSWWELPVEVSQAAVKARRYCWVTHGGWSQHYRLSLPTCHHLQLYNREADPSKCLTNRTADQNPTQGSLLSAWCRDLNSRDPDWGDRLCPWCAEQDGRAPAMGPSIYQMLQTAEKGPRQGSPQVSEWAGLWKKTCQRSLLIASYKKLEKTFW